MSAARGILHEALKSYTTDTLTYMNTVREFCVMLSTWTSRIGTDLIIKIKDDKTTSDKRPEKLEKELVAVLKRTLGGLEKLDCFLDAVEKLAVTSLHVFMEENHQMLSLPRGIEPEQVQDIIKTARLICPLLLQFKRDAAVFFLPKLQNVEVLSYQLDKYIETTQLICDKFPESGVRNLFRRMSKEIAVDLRGDLSEDEIQRMLCHINQLDEIRKNPDFRIVFLFQDKSCSSFVTEFRDCKPRMLQFLNDLEDSTVKLDRMKKITHVARRSVGVVSGVLSVVGLALMPFTGGLSLGLTLTGIVLGVTSVYSHGVVTSVTERVNVTQQNNANEVFQRFMEDMQSIQDCLQWSGVDWINQPLISLPKCSETEFSQLIRARTALCRSQMDSWQKIHDSLCEGQEKSEKNKTILETPFFPEMEKKKRCD